MNRNEFNQLASQVFGDRVNVHAIPLGTLNTFFRATPDKDAQPITQAEVEEYGAWPWVASGKCVVCGESLNIHFQWGIVHGCGRCSHCKGASYRFYHRVRGKGYPFMAYALIGWNDDVVEEHGLDPLREA